MKPKTVIKVRITLYSGNLIAALAIPSYEKPIESLFDVPPAIENNGYNIMAFGGSVMELIFRDADEGIYKKIWNLFNLRDKEYPSIMRDIYPDKYFTIKSYAARKYIVVLPETTVEIFRSRFGRVNYHSGREKFYPQLIGIACPTGAPFRLAFDK
ncbi:hypothetical protein SK128_009203, partial [Halocaridina rubra]